MYIRSISWTGVTITVQDQHKVLKSGMGHDDKWHALREGQCLIVIAWCTGLPSIGIELFDLEEEDDEPFDSLFNQEHEVYRAVSSWDKLSQESEEHIGRELWKIYQNYMHL